MTHCPELPNGSIQNRHPEYAPGAHAASGTFANVGMVFSVAVAILTASRCAPANGPLVPAQGASGGCTVRS